MNGLQFLRDWALPHFYFHVVTAYDILRHNGVDIGKRDYLSHVAGYIRPRSIRREPNVVTFVRFPFALWEGVRIMFLRGLRARPTSMPADASSPRP